MNTEVSNWRAHTDEKKKDLSAEPCLTTWKIITFETKACRDIEMDTGLGI